MQAEAGRHRGKQAGAVLAALSVVAATPVVAATAPSAMPAAGRAVQLAAAGDSVLNLGFNLFQQLVNIPNAEVEALGVLAKSLFFTGNWFTPSATNIWGEDPGDPGHFMTLVDLSIPFKAISGLGSPEIDPEAVAAGTAGLGQQLALLAAAELPASQSCDATWCAPVVPTTPITGFAPTDRGIWLLTAFTGLQQFPIVDHWLKVPLSDLTNGYTFPAVLNPSAGVGPGGAVPDDEVFGFPGTVHGPDGENLMPWSNLTFTLNLLGPFQNFYNSLLAPPDLSAFEFPTLEEWGRTLQSLVAAVVVDFNPLVPGSPYCGGRATCPAT